MKTLTKTLAAFAVTAGLIGFVATAAQADEWHNHEARAHEWHHRHFHHPHGGPVYVQQPNVVYAPPVVVEPPPVDQSSGVNLVFPLNFN